MNGARDCPWQKLSALSVGVETQLQVAIFSCVVREELNARQTMLPQQSDAVLTC